MRASLLAFALTACVGKGGPITDTSEVTDDTASADCVCDTTDACCDGCDPIAGNAGLPCDDGATGTWAACDASLTGECAQQGVFTTIDLGGERSATAAAWAPDASWVALALAVDFETDDGAVRVYSVPDGGQVHSIDGQGLGLTAHPGGDWIAACVPSGLQVVSMADLSTVHTGTCTAALAASPDGGTLAVTDGGDVVLYETETWTESARYDIGLDPIARVWTLAWSPDGARLLASSGQVGFGSPHGDIRLIDVAGGAIDETPLDCTGMDVAWSPDSAAIAAACWNSVKVFDATGAETGEFSLGPQALGVEWTADGGGILVGTLLAGVRLVDPTGQDLTPALTDDAGSGTAKVVERAPTGGVVLGAGWQVTEAILWSL